MMSALFVLLSQILRACACLVTVSVVIVVVVVMIVGGVRMPAI